MFKSSVSLYRLGGISYQEVSGIPHFLYIPVQRKKLGVEHFAM